MSAINIDYSNYIANITTQTSVNHPTVLLEGTPGMTPGMDSTPGMDGTSTVPPPSPGAWLDAASRATVRYGMGALLVVGLTNNLLALYTLLDRELRKSGINFLLISLAVWDFLALATSPLRVWLIAITNGEFDIRTQDTVICKLHLWLTYVSVQMSPLTLCAVTIERVISVWLPLHARAICSRRNTVTVYLAFTAVVVLANLVTLMMAEVKTFHSPDGLKSKNCAFPAWIVPYWVPVAATLTSYIPCTTLIIGNSIIVLKILDAQRKRLIVAEGQEDKKQNSSRNTTNVLVMVCVFFLLTGSPFPFYMVFGPEWPYTRLTPYWRSVATLIYNILILLSNLNNSMNFVFYVAFGTEYRKRFIRRFLRK